MLNAWASVVGVPYPFSVAAALSLFTALVYFSAWLPFGACGGCGCTCARPLPIADLVVLDAADIEGGCACASLLCCVQRTCRAEKEPRRRMLKRIATQPILQLCVCMCALASAVLIVACAPRMHTFDADGSGTTTLLESANGFVQQASSLRPNGGGGGGALKEIDARARAAATEWFDRVCCETAAFSRSGALSFHARVCASAQGRCATMASGTASKWGRRSRSSARSATVTATSPQLRMWDLLRRGVALRYRSGE